MRGALVVITAVSLFAACLITELLTNVLDVIVGMVVVIAFVGLFLLAVANWVDGDK